MRALHLVWLVWVLGSGAALAACPNPFVVKDGNSASQNVSTSSDGSGNCEFNMSIGAIGGVNVVPDPCQAQAHNYTPINNAASATTTTIVPGTSGKKTYVCNIFIAPTATPGVNLGIVEGTGTNCSTVSAGVIGGTTAATGPNLSANGGFVDGDGLAAVASTATVGDNLCFAYSAAVQVSGHMVWVQQ
jgi:hypothetical protein